VRGRQGGRGDGRKRSGEEETRRRRKPPRSAKASSPRGLLQKH
jgi:hypothetical protein